MELIRSGSPNIYYKVYEFSTLGSYNVYIPENATCEVTLVGGGGGGTYSRYTNPYVGTWTASSTGGSAGMIQGTTNSIAEGTYEVVVGSGGTYATCQVGYPTQPWGVYGGNGGDTIAFGNTANGGGGGYSYTGAGDPRATHGSGGSFTVVSNGLEGSEGVTGSATSRYETYGGGGGATVGQGGYAKIAVSSTVEFPDYDYQVSHSDYYAIRQLVRKYYKYVSAPWTSPILFANGTIGGDSFAVAASTEQTSYGRYAYCAFDGDSSTGWAASSASCWIEFYNPNPLNVTNIFFTNFDAYYPATLELWASDDGTNYTQISAAVTTGTNGNTIDCSSNTNFYKIYKIQFPSTRAYGAKEITITATQKIAQESTSSDYDFYKDVNTYNATKLINSVEVPYYIPTLSSNGVMGGTEFACDSANSYRTTWNFVSNGGGTAVRLSDLGNWVSWYYPNQTKITSIIIDFDSITPDGVTGKFQASNDNLTWIDLSSYTENDEELDGVDISPVNPDFYSYYRVTFDSSASHARCTLLSIEQVYTKQI